MTSTMPHAYPTVLHMLAAAAEAAPNRTALRCGDEQLTYRDYLACVGGFAQELGEGVRGGRVALIMANSIDIAIAFYAVGAAGAQVVPLNPAFERAKAELREMEARLKSGGGDGTSGGMEARVAVLEAHVEHIRGDLAKLADIPVSVAEIKTELGHKPSKGFIVTSAVGTITALTAILILLAKLHILS